MHLYSQQHIYTGFGHSKECTYQQNMQQVCQVQMFPTTPTARSPLAASARTCFFPVGTFHGYSDSFLLQEAEFEEDLSKRHQNSFDLLRSCGLIKDYGVLS